MHEIKHKLNLYRRYFSWKKAKCIYIHVPKAAGTSISKSIYGKTLGHYTATEICNKFPKLYYSAYKFSFVRNPWDRVLSAYRFAKVGRTESMGIHNPEQYDIPAFTTFESFVLEWLYGSNLEDLDFVFQPQYKFQFSKQGKLMVDYVGKVENIQSDIINIERKLGRRLNLTNANRTSAGVDYSEYYTNTNLIEAVKSLYKKDIKLFGYEF